MSGSSGAPGAGAELIRVMYLLRVAKSPSPGLGL
jgi:hypothetical protein